LYKNSEILTLFKEVFATEKIHGTSAAIHWKPIEKGEPRLGFHAGGANFDSFVALFDKENLNKVLAEKFPEDGVSIHGEAYGGKLQGMSGTYGKELKFIAFDVKIGDSWLDVPNAKDFCDGLGIEFVHYERIPCELSELDKQRDADSVQAIRNLGIIGKPREGIVIRPIIELFKKNGERMIFKHKREEFIETKTPREVDPAKMKVLEEARAISDEWVTPMRLQHILDKNSFTTIEQTKFVIEAMLEDVKRESEGEVVWSDLAEKEIARAAAKMYKKNLFG